ncbi:MAG: DUF3828 domain-containing protein [Acidobacteria bacterium]|nr:DUF3828 domain-containing protein [Acidobacteriota bacterium]
MKVLIVLFAITVAAAEPARDFYTAYKNLKFEGLPNKAQLDKLAPHMSTGMRNAIKSAQALQAKCMNKFPTDKPMWIEGDLFTSNFEGFTSFKVGESDNTKAIVEFEYVEKGQKVVWKDKLLFVREKGKLVIDDVRFGRTEGFTSGYGESLRKSLGGTGCE